MEIGDGVWVTLPEGTVLICPNPYWNEDWAETRFSYRVKLKKAMKVPLGAVKEWVQTEVLEVLPVEGKAKKRK